MNAEPHAHQLQIGISVDTCMVRPTSGDRTYRRCTLPKNHEDVHFFSTDYNLTWPRRVLVPDTTDQEKAAK